MIFDPTFHDLIIGACKQPGCPVCRLERSTEEDYLDDLLRKYLKEPEVSKDIRESLGLCHEHSWQLLNSKYCDALAFSLIYHGILQAAINNLQSEDRPLRSQRRLPSFLKRFNRKPLSESKNTTMTLTSHKSCPACEQCDRTAWLAMEILGLSLENEVMGIALESSDGLCLPHLRLAYAVMQDSRAYQILHAISVKKLESLRLVLVEIIRENESQPNKKNFSDMMPTWARIFSITVGDQ